MIIDIKKLVYYHGRMKLTEATQIFTALSQQTRLQVFKILIKYGRSGVAAGKISEQLGIPHNTLSFHLSHLCQAGLISVEKNGRSMILSSQRQNH